MSAFNTVMSMSAAADASAAKAEARKAKDAAESAVDGLARFITIPLAKFETIEETEGKGFFSSTIEKRKLVGENKRVSIKHTDVANIQEGVDDFGNKYAKLVLEERGEFYDEQDEEYYGILALNLSLADATAIVNGAATLT